MDRPQRRIQHPDQLAAFPDPARRQIKTILIIVIQNIYKAHDNGPGDTAIWPWPLLKS